MLAILGEEFVLRFREKEILVAYMKDWMTF